MTLRDAVVDRHARADLPGVALHEIRHRQPLDVGEEAARVQQRELGFEPQQVVPLQPGQRHQHQTPSPAIVQSSGRTMNARPPSR